MQQKNLFRYITFPMLAPATTINITLAFTQSLKVFDIVYAMTNGGPLNATETVGTYVIRNMGLNLHGYASAMIRSSYVCYYFDRYGAHRTAEKEGGGNLLKKKQRDKLFFTIFMYLVTLVIFYPMIMMLLVSLKSKAEVVSNPVGVKMSFQFSNYTEAFREMNYPMAL